MATPMGPEDIAFAGVEGQLALLEAGEIGAVELLELHLERIGRLEPELGAFRVVLTGSARAEAEAADRRRSSGEGAAEAPLLGVPIAVKDTVDLAGETTLNGTSSSREAAGSDEPFAARLRAAGAVIVGKTNLPELAIYGFTETRSAGITRNPWDTGRTPGGSSGGSGAAVAAGLCAAASASDGAGSIRIPAAFCGLVGLKPGRGLVPFGRGEEHWHGLSVNGFVTRTVADQALLLDVAIGAGDAPGQTREAPAGGLSAAIEESPRELRVATSLAPMPGGLPTRASAEALQAVSKVARLLGKAGHQISEHDIAWGLAGQAFIARYLAGIAEDVAGVADPQELEPRTRGLARLGRRLEGRALRWARRREASDRARVGGLFEHHDLLVTPTTAQPAPEVGRWRGKGAMATLLGMGRVYPYTPGWNHLGLPVVSIPAGLDAGGLPLAAQLIAPPGEEALLLSVAADLEQRIGWPELRPPLH